MGKFVAVTANVDFVLRVEDPSDIKNIEEVLAEVLGGRADYLEVVNVEEIDSLNQK